MKNTVILSFSVLLLSFVAINATIKEPQKIVLDGAGTTELKQFMQWNPVADIEGKMVSVDVAGEIQLDSRGRGAHGKLTLLISDQFKESYECVGQNCRIVDKGSTAKTEIVMKNIRFDSQGQAISMEKTINQTLVADSGMTMTRDMSEIGLFLKISLTPGGKNFTTFLLPGRFDMPRTDANYYLQLNSR